MKEQDNISPIDQYVIDIVRELRKSIKVSQKNLGYALGFEKTFIGSVESVNHRAKYNLSHINLLAEYFNLSPGFFLPEKPITSVSQKEKQKLVREIHQKVASVTVKKVTK